MGYLKAKDTISGQEAKAYATIGDRTEEMFFAKKIEAKAKKKKSELRTLGRRGTQNKAAGWIGTGKMTVYYVTSLFRKMMLEYIQNGKDLYFEIQLINEDPSSSVGKQTILLKNVNLDSVMMAALDVGTDVLEEEMTFTFEDAEILDEFVSPVLGG